MHVKTYMYARTYITNELMHFGIGDMMVLIVFMSLDMSEWGKSSTPNLGKDLLRPSLSVTIYSGLQL